MDLRLALAAVSSSGAENTPEEVAEEMLQEVTSGLDMLRATASHLGDDMANGTGLAPTSEALQVTIEALARKARFASEILFGRSVKR